MTVFLYHLDFPDGRRLEFQDRAALQAAIREYFATGGRGNVSVSAEITNESECRMEPCQKPAA